MTWCYSTGNNCILETRLANLLVFPLSTENYSLIPLKILYDLNFPTNLKGLSC